MDDKGQMTPVLAVARRLQAFERAEDRALIRGFELGAELLGARLATNIAAGRCQDVLDDHIASLSALADARRHTIQGHAKLEALRAATGLPPVMIGDKEEGPPIEGTGATMIRLVA